MRTVPFIIALALLSCNNFNRNNPFDAHGGNWHPPEVTAMVDTSVNINDSLTITAVGRDNGTINKFVWARKGNLFKDTTDSGSLTVAYPDTGRHVVRVKVIDDDGVVSQADSCIVKVTPDAPIITPTVSVPNTMDGWKSFDWSTGTGVFPVTLAASGPINTRKYTFFAGLYEGSLIQIAQIYSGIKRTYNFEIDSSTTVLYRLVVNEVNGDSVLVDGKFVTPPPPGVKDVDGNYYPAVILGNQMWTTVNLRTTRYNDGASIPYVTDTNAWALMDSPAFCFYDNTTDSTARKKYGALYNWYTVNTGRLAPSGWRVPTYKDWDTLQNYLITNGYNYDNSAGNKIAKAMAANYDWTSSSNEGAVGNNPRANNTSGFSALPGGYRGRSGDFLDLGDDAVWWSAAENTTDNNHTGAFLGYENYYLIRIPEENQNGLSVRLVRDIDSR